MNRYARQNTVPGFGPETQTRLRGARALVVGAGGLAAPLLPYLAGAGVGALRLVDPDYVELHNLPRQTLFGMTDLGRPKAAAAAERLGALTDDCAVETHICTLDPANLPGLAEGCDLLIDCADRLSVSYALSDFAKEQGLPLVSAAVTGQSGYAGGFCGGAPSLRAVFPDAPEALGDCASDGVLGPVVGVIASLQAQMALSVLAGEQEALGQLVRFDAQSWHFGGFRFDGAPEQDGPPFIAASDVTPDDALWDLRRDQPLPEGGARLVIACVTGLRAMRAARAMENRARPVVLLALGALD